MSDPWTIQRKIRAQEEAEKEGRVADSMEVRLKLVERVRRGEISLNDAQAELKRIQREAKRNGQITRAQAFSRG